MIVEYFLFSLVKRVVAIVSTSFLCSSCLVPNVGPVSPI